MEQLNIIQDSNFKEYTEKEYNKLKEENMNNVFAIPCKRVITLYNKLLPYAKKADKLNIPYSITELGTVNILDEECLIISIEFKIQLKEWQFVASIDHLDGGNIVKSAVKGLELPEKYRTAKNTTCDHCKTVRYRKQTCIVYNTNTKEFKQVGKDCLKVYTGLDLSNIALFLDIWSCCGSDLSESSYDDFLGFFGNSEKYVYVNSVICLAYDIVKTFGYVKKGNDNSTIRRYYDFESYLDGSLRKYCPYEYKKLKAIVEEKDLKFFSKESYEKADEIIKYVLSQKVTNDYMNNMHVLLSSETASRKYLGFLVSAVAVYNNGQEKEKQYKEEHKQEAVSKHVGTVGNRITIDVKEAVCLTSWENDFGVTFIYKFVDNNNNIYTWKTSKVLNDDIKGLTGTIKAHNDYKGIKQTELTRCKIA